MTHTPDPLPPGAEVFPGGESLINSLKGDKLMAVMLAPLGIAAAGLCFALVFMLWGHVKTPGDLLGFVLILLLAAVPALGCNYPLWALYKGAQKMQGYAPLYKERAIVVTQDYLEIFTGAMEEHERLYYAKRNAPVIQLPWDTIADVALDNYKTGKHSRERGYVIATSAVHSRFSGKLRVMGVHFQTNEDAILQAIARKRGAPIKDRTQVFL